MNSLSPFLRNVVLPIAAFCVSTVSASEIVFTTDTTINPSNTSYDGQDIVVSNATLTVDGPHTFSSLLIASNSVLTHSFSNTGILLNTIVNEVHSLDDTNSATLLNSNVVVASVVVTDPNMSVTYSNDVDYLLTPLGVGLTGLQRTTNSTIPDGATVYVSYQATTPAGLNLTLTANLEIAAGGILNANGRGFGGNLGTGNGGETGSILTGAGAGYGGYGGLSSSNAPGGQASGIFDQPTALGSGGGQGVGGVGGTGGGAIRLIVSGDVLVEGVIAANGSNATNSRSGGGSGGSIWITAATFSGDGSITAHGGNGEPIHGGGGGGGRIALYGTNNFSGELAAYGGLGWQAGGAGTIYTKPTTGTGLLLVDNAGRAGTNTSSTLTGMPSLTIRGSAVVALPTGSWAARDVLVASNSTLTTFAINTSLSLAASNLTVEPTGSILADGKGSTDQTLGFAGTYAGGGHGGAGGNSKTNGLGGVGLDGLQFTAQVNPTAMGRSGGGTNTSITSGGGLGGGAIRLIVSQHLVLNGRISSSGLNSVPAGGGSGGSIWITAATISGTGAIAADGGNGNFASGGGGGGGRIALYVTTTNQFAGPITAYGGSGANRGGAGTIYLDILGVAGQLLREFILDNGGFAAPNAFTNTMINGFSAGSPTPVLTIRNGAAGQVANANGLSVVGAFIGSNSSLAVASPMTVTSNALIEAGGRIYADGLAFGGNGPGSSVIVGSSIYYCGGGGHGGYGGNGGTNNARGGNSYGLATNPNSSGSPGAGSGSSFSPFGGAGGGLLRLTVNGSLTNHGRISSDGKVGSGSYAGGGAGGSVVLAIGKLYGAGLISANGGAGLLPGGGGGGGGRIAVTCTSNFFSGPVTAYGGSGANYGGAGTTYLKTNQFPSGQIIVDNGGNLSTNTTVSETSFAGDLTVAGGGAMIFPFPSGGLRTVSIKTNGVLLALTGSSIQLTLSGNMTIDAGGLFSLDGAQGGSGAGSFNQRGGGGHGGYGGGNTVSGGNAYDLVTTPTMAGSSGGGGVTSPPFGGVGGGALRLQFSGNGILTVNGRLSADGRSGDLNAGGGSGGSLWLTPAVLTGSGIISANGGAGLGNAGGGGGGRIAITYNSNSFTGQLTAFGGSGVVAGGAGTIYTAKFNNTSAGTVLIDNGAQSGTNTPLSSSFALPGSPFNLTVSGGASALALTPLPQLSNLVISAGSVLTMRPPATNVFVEVLRNATIAAGGAINVDGDGFAPSQGPGPGASYLSKGAGGGHGGAGGNSQSGALGGTNYDSVTQPVLRGSGGGAGANAYVSGSEGGGAIRMIVGGVLSVEGNLSANGNDGIQDDSGGGAGGSIWLTTGTLTGNGVIAANGGDGDLFGGGGGGGGRIAIYAPSNTFNGVLTVAGGTGANPGQPGSLFVTTNPAVMVEISGTITNENGQGVEGVSLQPSGGLTATMTDTNGSYLLSVPSGWTGQVTPSFGTNMFVPGIYSYAGVVNPITNRNHLMVGTIAPAMSSSLSGTNLSINWSGIPGVTYQPESSTNLLDWLPYGSLLPGTNGSMQLLVPTGDDPLLFVRLRAAN